MSEVFRTDPRITDNDNQEQRNETFLQSSRSSIKKLVLMAVPLMLLAFAGFYLILTGSVWHDEIDSKAVSRQTFGSAGQQNVPSQNQRVKSKSSNFIAQTITSVGWKRLVVVASVVVVVIVAVVVTAVFLSGGEEPISVVDPEPVVVDKVQGGGDADLNATPKEESNTGLIVGLSIGCVALVAFIVLAVKLQKIRGCLGNGMTIDNKNSTQQGSVDNVNPVDCSSTDNEDVDNGNPVENENVDNGNPVENENVNNDIPTQDALVDEIIKKLSTTSQKPRGHVKYDAFISNCFNRLEPKPQWDLLLEESGNQHDEYVTNLDRNKVNILTLMGRLFLKELGLNPIGRIENDDREARYIVAIDWKGISKANKFHLDYRESVSLLRLLFGYLERPLPHRTFEKLGKDKVKEVLKGDFSSEDHKKILGWIS